MADDKDPRDAVIGHHPDEKPAVRRALLKETFNYMQAEAAAREELERRLFGNPNYKEDVGELGEIRRDLRSLRDSIAWQNRALTGAVLTVIAGVIVALIVQHH